MPALLAAWFVIAALAAAAIVDSHAEARAGIEERLRMRADLTARFVDSYVRDFARREARAARRDLSKREISRADFDRVIDLLGTEAAVLLDRNGRLLQVAPHAPELIGTDPTKEYAHLREAVAGSPAVSDIVPSAAEGRPIVGFAVPFESDAGRRVLSGAFDVASTPLAAYLKRAAAVAPNRVHLVDGNGKVIAASDPDSPVPAVPDGVEAGGIEGFHAGGDEYVARTQVPGTSWQILFVAPEATLYDSVQGPQRWISWFLWLGFTVGGLVCVLLIGRVVKSRERTEQLARIDVLTGNPNRRATDEALSAALAESRRYGHDTAVVLVDVDHFKQLNDSRGHATGDAALRHVAGCLGDEIRAGDTAGRWGGDEFLVVLAHASAADARVVAERLRERVARTPLVTEGGDAVSLTVSVGAAVARVDDDPASLVHRADGRMYRGRAERRADSPLLV